MDINMLLQNAIEMQSELQENRRELHRHPEVGMDLIYTKAYVKEKLKEMGYEPEDCGKSGVVALAGGYKKGKCFLIRGDMDALPIEEEADVPFRSQHPGKMHACGHDTHTAMLLGAAKLLKQIEQDIPGTVKLMFQPGEEILLGAADMIEAGVLENPAVDAAMMIHAWTGMQMPKGILAVMDGGCGMASCDQYRITVQGKGGHGSMPQTTVDPVTIASHIQIALAEIHSRELTPGTFGVITNGMIHAGTAANIIPDTCVMEGTIRAADEATEAMLKKRLCEICEGMAALYRGSVTVEYVKYCPPAISDQAVADASYAYLKELFGKEVVFLTEITGQKVMAGSEDFAFITGRVPSVLLMMSLGDFENGCVYPQHHPKAKFEDDILYKGAAAYAHVALRWLEENKD